MRKTLSAVCLVLCLLGSYVQIAQAEIQSSLKLNGVSFISSDYDNTADKKFGFVGAHLVSNPLDPQIFMLDIEGVNALGHPILSYLNVREIYFTINQDPQSTIYLGRKLLDWSILDQAWSLGFFEPRFRWNSLDFQNQGMTGLFWENKNHYGSLTLFASYLFIPDQGPSYEIKDGEFQNSNPWFNPPPQGIRFGSVVRPIDYNVHTPPVSDVIFQPVLAAKFHFGQKVGFWGSVASAIKPSSQLAMDYKNVYATSRVRADVYPKTYNETVVATDLGYGLENQNYIISTLFTNPQQPEYESGSNYPVLEKSISYGPTMQWKAGVWKHQLSYFRTDGGQVTEVGPDVTPDRQPMTQRFLFRDAVQLQLEYEGFLNRQLRLNTLLQYRQGFIDVFKYFRLKNSVDIEGPWRLWLDLILMETAQDGTSPMEPTRNLDQVWLGVSYDL